MIKQERTTKQHENGEMLFTVQIRKKKIQRHIFHEVSASAKQSPPNDTRQHSFHLDYMILGQAADSM
ncbi:hypothetical protein U0070_014019, partial [Myodes glareolus]